MTYQPMYIEWIDSTMRKTVWVEAAELLNHTAKTNMIINTMGYLINENKLEYILASSIHFEDNDIVAFGQIFTIPKGCVTNKRKIKIL